MTNPFPRGQSALYRLYDWADVLLYLGISHQPDERFKQHAGDKPWWHLVARREIVWLDNRDEALKAEAEALVDERPLYNGYHHLGRGWPQKARKYDDTAGRTAVRDAVRRALRRGDYRPGTYLQAAPIGRHLGVAPVTAFHALRDLVREGALESRRFRVPGSPVT